MGHVQTSRKSNIKKGIIAKVVITFVLLFLTGLGTLIYSLNSSGTLLLYPTLKENKLEFLINTDKESLQIVESLLKEKKDQATIRFVIGRRKISSTLSLKRLDLEQKDCPEKFKCPVFIIPKDEFEKEFVKLDL